METKQRNNKWDFPFKKDNLNDNKIYKTWYKSWHKYLFLREYKSEPNFRHIGYKISIKLLLLRFLFPI